MSTVSSRHRFVHSGRTVYEWEQTLEEVTIDIPLPPGATKKDLAVKVTNDHLTVGLKGLPPYLDVSTHAGGKQVVAVARRPGRSLGHLCARRQSFQQK